MALRFSLQQPLQSPNSSLISLSSVQNDNFQIHDSLFESNASRGDDMRAEGQEVSHPAPSPNHHGTSSIASATYNFTNSIIGAGAIGLGGAIAKSGGLISVASTILYALMTKLSLDMLIRLSIQTENAHSFEDLAQLTYGKIGKYAVVFAKFTYSFGCMVAYVIVVRDNLSPALLHLLWHDQESSDSWMYELLQSRFYSTWAVASLVLLPMCLLRDLTYFAAFSFCSIFSMFAIIGIVIWLYIEDPSQEIRHAGGGFKHDWLDVRPGFLPSIGSFVFCFVSQHTANMTFDSLKPELQNLQNWKVVSASSLLLSCFVSLLIGIVVYISFWDQTQSNIFNVYPNIPLIDLAKLLLCTTLILTFPLPFFTCRELIILTFYSTLPSATDPIAEFLPIADQESMSLQEPLLDGDLEVDSQHDCIQEEDIESELMSTRSFDTSRSLDISTLSVRALNILNSALLPGEDRQLRLIPHVGLSVKMWVGVVGFAIAAPSLGDVLGLVGCVSGTSIAFIFPALISFRIDDKLSCAAVFIFVVGGLTGVIGSFFSFQQLIHDVR